MATRRGRYDEGFARHAGRFGATVLAAAALVLAAASPVSAHDPIFIDDATPPEESPRILDGSVSFATYGVIEQPGGSGHLRLDLEAGEELVVELLVPDQPPENTLVDFSHLRATVLDPSGTQTVLTAGAALGRFDEPFTGTSYLRLIESTEPALPGTYTVTVTSEIPTRFTLATGRTEQFGTPVEDYERRPLSQLDSWYELPPPATAVDEPMGGGQPEDPTSTTASPAGDDEESNREATADTDSGSRASTAVLILAAIGLGAAATAGVLVLRRRAGPRSHTDEAAGGNLKDP